MPRTQMTRQVQLKADKFHLLESLEQLDTFSTSGLVFFVFFGTYGVKSRISVIFLGPTE